MLFDKTVPIVCLACCESTDITNIIDTICIDFLGKENFNSKDVLIDESLKKHVSRKDFNHFKNLNLNIENKIIILRHKKSYVFSNNQTGKLKINNKLKSMTFLLENKDKQIKINDFYKKNRFVIINPSLKKDESKNGIDSVVDFVTNIKNHNKISASYFQKIKEDQTVKGYKLIEFFYTTDGKSLFNAKFGCHKDSLAFINNYSFRMHDTIQDHFEFESDLFIVTKQRIYNSGDHSISTAIGILE